MDIDALVLPVTADALIAASQMVVGFILLMFLGALLLPGVDRLGYALPNGMRKNYKLTGMTLFFYTHVVVGIGTAAFGLSLAPMITHFWSLLIVMNIVAFSWSFALFLWGKRKGAESLSHGEGLRLPVWLKDIWFGNELNPTWIGVDLKMFMYQPSLIGVGLFVAAFGYLQFEQLARLTPQMICFLAFWWIYLWTHYVKEEFMLSTWDVISENFGFMLVWGDLVYVPFFYCLPGWWIVGQAEPMTTPQWIGLVAFFSLSLSVFRQANWQKERYKRNKDVRIWGGPAKTVGGRLLVSGWWGIGRKINYTGEIGVYSAFALCAGLAHWAPYVLPLSLIILLTQRAARDDKKCRAKYGEVWQEYCQRVRFRIFPFLY